VTANDAAHYEFVSGIITEVLGHQRFRRMEYPVAGSEDFSQVLDRVSGCYVHLEPPYSPWGAARRPTTARR
jgi:metal-dependent amidase/aminoacylase/carboxypeptidase family protein